MAVARDLFGGLASTESRVLATLAVLLVAVGGGLIVLPRGLRLLGRVVARVGFGRQFSDEEQAAYDYVLAESLALRTLQVVLGVSALVSTLLIWGFAGVASDLATLFGSAAPTVGRVVVTVVLFAAALVAADLLEAKMEEFAEASTLINRHQQGIAFQVVRVSLLIAVGLTTLSVWDFSLDGLLVGAGFLGIVVGIAAQQTLSSLIAGFVIMFSRPFELGDWVEIDDTEGVVTDITIMNTRLRTAWGDTVVLPNDQVSNATVANHTEQNRLRLSVDVGVDYGTDLDLARETALTAIGTADKVESVPTPQVLPKAFGDSAVVLECRFWIKNPSARTRALATASVVQAIRNHFAAADVKIPFPQRELSGRPETGGLAVRDRAEASVSVAEEGVRDGDAARDGETGGDDEPRRDGADGAHDSGATPRRHPVDGSGPEPATDGSGTTASETRGDAASRWSGSAPEPDSGGGGEE